MADQIKTGIEGIDEALSEGKQIDLSVFHAPVPRIGVTQMWREALEKGWTAVHFDFEMASKPSNYEQMQGRMTERDGEKTLVGKALEDEEPPDKPITP